MLIETNGNFLTVVIASLPIAIGQPFFINSASKIATLWFGDNEVDKLYNHYTYREL